MKSTPILLSLSLVLCSSGALCAQDARPTKNPFGVVPAETEVQAKPAGPEQQAVSDRLAQAAPQEPVRIRQIRRRVKPKPQTQPAKPQTKPQENTPQDSSKPLDPYKPLKPLVPSKPLKPLDPYKPLQPVKPQPTDQDRPINKPKPQAQTAKPQAGGLSAPTLPASVSAAPSGLVGEGFQAVVGRNKIERLDFLSPMEAYHYAMTAADADAVEVRGNSVLMINGPAATNLEDFNALRRSVWGPEDTRSPSALAITSDKGETVIVASGAHPSLDKAYQEAQRAITQGRGEWISNNLQRLTLPDGSEAYVGRDADTQTYVATYATPERAAAARKFLESFTAEVEPVIPAERLAPGETDRPLTRALQAPAEGSAQGLGQITGQMRGGNN